MFSTFLAFFFFLSWLHFKLVHVNVRHIQISRSGHLCVWKYFSIIAVLTVFRTLLCKYMFLKTWKLFPRNPSSDRTHWKHFTQFKMNNNFSLPASTSPWDHPLLPFLPRCLHQTHQVTRATTARVFLLLMSLKCCLECHILIAIQVDVRL